jgi:FAD/FMN-containing dehydrogenase
MTSDALAVFAAKKQRLHAECADSTRAFALRKRTISNLFRYTPRERAASGLDLAGFNRVLALDVEAATLDVEGLTTYQTVVACTLAHGLLPLVSPELKHITVGGATVGIGIESSCFRHGFVHDGLVEAEVLLPDGRVVLCTADNEYADLFHALPNSYGTLGYILRAKIRLMPARPFVHLHNTPFSDLGDFLQAMERASHDPSVDFIEGLCFTPQRFSLMVARMVDHVPQVDDIVREHIFYRLAAERSDVFLTTQDYIFRYDPEWFWNIPETWPYRLFRRYAPRALRNSGFYSRYTRNKNALLRKLPGYRNDGWEPLIQDWEVPWDKAHELIEYGMREVELDGKPWVIAPIRTPRQPILYPVRANALYLNLGCYCQVRKVAGRPDYWYTRIMDTKCFDLGGVKMLYSSSFLSRAEFDALYNGAAYAQLKSKYDPLERALTLFAKAVSARQ